MPKDATASRQRDTRSSRPGCPSVREQPLPKAAFPTSKEIGELGRFADRVASGKVKLKYIKL
jgi:hypothetical protein